MKTETKKDYKIINAKVEVLQAALEESVLGCVEFSDGASVRRMYLWEYFGTPQFHLSDNDIWGIFENPGEDAQEILDSTLVLSFDGVDLKGEYYDIAPRLKEKSGAGGLLSFLIALVRCPNEDIDKILAAGIGKMASNVNSLQKYLSDEDE